MPLAFESLSHGTVAFGFFNVESDMLLLDRIFFFADRFCAAVSGLEAADGDRREAGLPGFRIAQPQAVGNLHGAIAGADLSGFIGATYEAWPFPADRRLFKQSPRGARTQARVERLILGFGQAAPIALVWDREARTVSVAEYRFDEAGFGELVGYVERGGLPRWRDEERPPYVSATVEALARADSPLLPPHLRARSGR